MRRKIAVCDDEKVMLRQLAQYLDQIQDETGEHYDLHYYTSAEDLLSHLPEGIQVILLDISMGKMTGMECARALRTRNFKGAIIFITSMTQYALEGYDVHAFAFLTKPLVYVELKDRLTDCFAHVDQAQETILPVDTAKGLELLPIQDILYIEVFRHETSFTLCGKKIVSTIQLAQVEQRLASYSFFRCHRSYLVNMAQVKRIGQDSVTLPEGIEVPLSKHRRRAFLEAFTKYMGGRFA